MGRGIGQKLPKLTKREEQKAYDAATERDGGEPGTNWGQCQRCGRYGPCDRDHRQNRTAWNTTPANLHLLGNAFGCGCHKLKTENPSQAIAEGFSVPRWANPREWPGYRHREGWVIYLDEPDEHGRWWQPITPGEALKLMHEQGWADE